MDSHRHQIARNLAEAAAAGPWDLELVAKRLRAAIGSRSGWVKNLAEHLLTQFPRSAEPDRLLIKILAHDGFGHVDADKLQVRRAFRSKPQMRPVIDWGMPALCTTTDLAEWLELTPSALDWFADVQGRNPKQTNAKLRHYNHRWVLKRGGKLRLLEAPRPQLKAIQRRVLHEIIDRIPPHEAAHAFRAGRSICTFAAPHVGRAAVWRLDLKDFFPSISASRVHALFRVAGYPLEVARALTGLCTTLLPFSILPPDQSSVPSVFWDRHLPQGAPTSPALSNLAAFRLDVRLSALAAKCGARYTRYADDLTFSGDDEFAANARGFRTTIFQIVIEEGFRPNVAKCRFMSAGMRQHLAGVVVNERLNVRRDDFDRLKAILTNCVRFGPAGQNRDKRADFRGALGRPDRARRIDSS